MSTIHIATLFAAETIARIYTRGLEVADALGLETSTWRAGDPTRSLYHFLAEVLAARDEKVATWAKAGYLSSAREDAEATGDSAWLKLLALEQFGVEVDDATHATPTITLTNSGGGHYVIAAGDLTVKSSASGKTYHNTSDGMLAGVGAVETFDLVADEAGSDSSVGVDEIDEMVTTYLGVTITGSTAGVGVDEPSPAEIEEQCLATLGALSPNGPPDAYEYVVRNRSLTGLTSINRAKTVANNTDGTVTIYVATPSGSASGADVSAAQDAAEEWATPLCVTPTVVSAAPITFNVNATITGDDLPADFEDLIESKLQTLFADPTKSPIGGLIATSVIIHAIHEAVPDADSVTLIAPAADVQLAANQVAILGTVTIAEV